MTAPSPGDFETVHKSITKAMTELRSEYRWIYHAAHDRTVGDSAKVQAGPADPTGGIVGSTEKARMRREATRAHGITPLTPSPSLGRLPRPSSMAKNDSVTR